MKKVLIIIALLSLTVLNSCYVEGRVHHHHHGAGAGVYVH
jgi:hypothetical protein